MTTPTVPLSHRLSLTVLAKPLALCRLEPTDDIPPWATSASQFLTISRTPTELSIVADDAIVPSGASSNRPYRALRVEGPLPLDLIGIFAPLATALAEARIPIFPIATFDTDYVLVHADFLSRAVDALTLAGYRIIAEAE